jgi:single-strand DNA-binding protein
VNERKKDGDDWVDDTTFIDCKAFGSKAEFISGHFRKGDPIWLTGRLSNDEWDDKETGKKRSKLEVLIGQCGFVPSKKDNSDSEFG